jgi:hypothetical protein
MDRIAESPAVCGACGDEEEPNEPHRRGRCRRCYDRWVRARPVGLGAWCNACGDRRYGALRHFELRKTWVVLCGSCAQRAEMLDPLPFSVAGLRLKLHRERRWGDRRGEAVGAPKRMRFGNERRDGDRRVSERNILDATEFAELVLELDAEFADAQENEDPADGPITGVHRLVEIYGAR